MVPGDEHEGEFGLGQGVSEPDRLPAEVRRRDDKDEPERSSKKMRPTEEGVKRKHEEEMQRIIKFLKSGYPMRETSLSLLVTEHGEVVTDEQERRTVMACLLGVDIMEVFSPERVATAAEKYRLIPGASLDLTTGWDLSKEDVQEKAWEVVYRDNPFVIIGSPPCTLYSTLQPLTACNMKGHAEREATFEQDFDKARRHVAFCIKLYHYQMSKSGFFLHEHPWSASSWKLWCRSTLSSRSRLHATGSNSRRAS